MSLLDERAQLWYNEIVMSKKTDWDRHGKELARARTFFPGFSEHDPVLQDLAEQVTLARTRAKLSQTALAHLLGTKQSAISRLETAQAWPTISFLLKVSEMLNLKLVIQLQPK